MEDFVSQELAEFSSGSGVVDNYTLTLVQHLLFSLPQMCLRLFLLL